ncbi:MAG TPA: polymer-forming cytoskeletal protein [Thermoanaerobaculia bacterium]|nr:polymer-forming cytoskeletal protein [Thermoanaerobaculia bacterium]
MSIFRRDTAAPARPSGVAAPPADASSTPRSRITQIAPGSRIQGEVTGATELLVEGEVVGTIRVEATVEVGAAGVVKGPITAQVVRVAGKVIGNVRGTDRVEVGAAAVLEGDIAAPRVVIAEGAFFKGKVEMRGGLPDKSPDKSPSKPADKAANPSANSSANQAKAGRPTPGAEPKRES